MANKFLNGIEVSSSAVVDGGSLSTGSTILDIQGSQGQLFSVTNSLVGDLFSVSDISGIPILNVNSSGAVNLDGTLVSTGNISGLNLSGTNTGDNAINSLYSGLVSYPGDQDLSGYLLNTTDTLTGELTVSSKILAKGEIINSSAALQVNGFQRTGNIYLHSGGNTPDTAHTEVIISNVSGNLLINKDISADNLSGTNTGDQNLSGYLLNTTDTLTGDLTVTGSVISQGTGNNTFVGNILIDNIAPIIQANSSNGGSGLRINVTGLTSNNNSLVRLQNAGQTVVTVQGDGDATFVGNLSADNLSGTNTGDQDLSGYQLKSEKDSANGYAGLDSNSKINPSQLPALAITDTFVVANQAAMLALTVEVGDIAVRSDLSKSFILKTTGATTLANWQELLTPTDTVQSIFGRSGAVTAQANDYTWAQINKTTSSLADITSNSHTLLDDVGSNTHAQIDTALTRLANTSGTNTGDQDLSGYLLSASVTRPYLHGKLYSTSGDADLYTEFGIYRNYGTNGPIGTGHNTLLNVVQTDGNYGFQLSGDTSGGKMYYRTKGTTFGSWNTLASESFVTSQGYTGDQDLSSYITTSTADGKYLLNTTDTLDGDLTVTGKGVFAGAIKITETGTAQHILIGNQDSGGTDKPSMIQGVNGKLNFGYGSSWTGEGGTMTTTLSLSSSGNATFAGDVTASNLSGTNTGDQDLSGYQPAGTYNGIIGTDADINTSGALVVDQLNMTDGVITSHSVRSLTAANIGAADTGHKYHSFANGQVFTDTYAQGNYLRLFTENAVYDTFRFRDYTNVQSFDGTNWNAWSQSLDVLFDGREETSFRLLRANKSFRFEINRSSGWPTIALFSLQTSWSNVNTTHLDVILETWSGSAWVVKDTKDFNGFTRGTNLWATSATHDGKNDMRVTINCDWTDVSHNYINLKRILFLSNFSGGQVLDPWSWNYAKKVTFQGDIQATNFTGSSEGTNTGDQDLSGYLLNTSDTLTGTLIIDGGTGVASSGVLHVRQKGDTVADGIAITSSHGTSHRIWKDVSGNLKLTNSSGAGAVIDLSGNITATNLSGTNTGDQVLTGLNYAATNHNHDLEYLPMSYTDVDMDTYDGDKSMLLGRNVGGWLSGTKPAGSHNGFGILHVTTHVGGYATQFGFDTNQNKIWVRSRNPATWNTWQNMWTSTDFTSTNISNWNTSYTHSQAAHAPSNATPDQDLSGYLLNTSDILTGQFRVDGVMMLGDSSTANTVASGVQLHIKNTGNAGIRLEDSDASNLAFDISVSEGDGFVIKETIGGDSGDDVRLRIAETTGVVTVTNNLFASNLSGTNTGDQDLSGLTGDQDLSSYYKQYGTVATNTDADSLPIGFSKQSAQAGITNFPNTYGSTMTFDTGSYYGWQLSTNSEGQLHSRAKHATWGGWRTIWDNTNHISGTGAANWTAGNDARLSDARTPTAHNHNDLYYTEAESNAKYLLNTTDTLTGELSVTGGFGLSNSSPTTKAGISLYGGATPGEPTYGMMFAGTPTSGTHGGVTSDWATYFTMNDSTNRGWIFRRVGSGNYASISGEGGATFDAYVQTPVVNISNATISNQANTNVTGLELVAQVAVATYTAAFFDYVIKKGTNVRAGVVYACHDGTNVEFSETSTVDLGNTSDVALSVDISGGQMRLLANAATTSWSVKSLIRAI